MPQKYLNTFLSKALDRIPTIEKKERIRESLKDRKQQSKQIVDQCSTAYNSDKTRATEQLRVNKIIERLINKEFPLSVEENFFIKKKAMEESQQSLAIKQTK
jgi:hypothetical protein